MAKTPQPRKEATSVRLEPKVKYLVEIAARIQRRSVTNYIEWALEESLHNIHLEDNISGSVGLPPTLDYLKDYLWDIDEAKRFLILAIYYPDLLTYEEEKLLNTIKTYRYIYLKDLTDPHDSDLNSALKIDNINFTILNNDWSKLINAANDDKESILSLEDKKQAILNDHYKDKREQTIKVGSSIKAKSYSSSNEKQRIKEFMKTLTTPKTKEEYEQQATELYNFLSSLINEN